MNTLDEVITGMTELILSGKTADVKSTVRDALHYLKAYREDKDELDRTRLAYLDILTDYVALKNYWAEQQENVPLTWDELKAMEGTPVWVEYGIGFNQKRWVVIHSFHNAGSFCYMNVSGNYPNTFWQKDMGEDEFWQAYRKARE